VPENGSPTYLGRRLISEFSDAVFLASPSKTASPPSQLVILKNSQSGGQTFSTPFRIRKEEMTWTQGKNVLARDKTGCRQAAIENSGYPPIERVGGR